MRASLPPPRRAAIQRSFLAAVRAKTPRQETGNLRQFSGSRATRPLAGSNIAGLALEFRADSSQLEKKHEDHQKDPALRGGIGFVASFRPCGACRPIALDFAGQQPGCLDRCRPGADSGCGAKSAYARERDTDWLNLLSYFRSRRPFAWGRPRCSRLAIGPRKRRLRSGVSP